MAPLRCAAKFDPFLSLDCAPTPSSLVQSKERKGSNFAIWQPCFQEFIVEGFETKAKNFPTRKLYEKRREHELLVDKYSKEMSVGDILKMYPDPEEYFGKLDRKVSDLYKKLSLAHLKREFRQIMSTPITQVCYNLPSVCACMGDLKYRVTFQVVPNLLLTSKLKCNLCFDVNGRFGRT